MVVVTRVAILAVLAASGAVVPASAKADDVDAEDAPAADTSRDYSGDVDWSGPAWCAPSCAEWGCVGSLCDACALHAPGGGPGCQCVACACAPGRPVCDEICRLVAASGNEIFLQACDDGTSCRCDAPSDALNGCSCSITSRSGFLGLLFAAAAAAVLLVRRRRGPPDVPFGSVALVSPSGTGVTSAGPPSP